MSKYTKIIAALGIAAGLGVSSLPMAGVFAATTMDATQPIGVKVASDISISADQVTFEKDSEQTNLNLSDEDAGIPVISAGGEATLTGGFKVSTNNKSGYNVKISMDGDTNDLKASGTNDTIAATDNSAGWGITSETTNIKDDPTEGLIGKITDRTVVPTTDGVTIVNNNKQVNTKIVNEATVVTYHVQAKDDQASGVYKGTVKFTASVNN